MPQMSPMPWIMILFMTILSLNIINSYIFFLNQKKSSIHMSKIINKFYLKW